MCSTCFEQLSVHPQEDLYMKYYSILLHIRISSVIDVRMCWILHSVGSYYTCVSQCTVLITRVYHNSRFLLHVCITMHGSYYTCVSQCTVLITRVYHNARFLLHVCITMHGSRKRKALSTHTIGRTNSLYTSDDTQPDVLWQSTRRRSLRTLNRIQYQTPNYEVESQNAQWSRVRRAG